MTRHPPLPRGPPPRDAPPRSSHGGDSYRPNHGSQFTPINGHRESMYQFEGASSRDQYPSRDYSDRYSRSHETYRQSDHDVTQMGRGDSYRPRQSDFNFRFEAPGVEARKFDMYRPQISPRDRKSARDSPPPSRHSRRSEGGRGRGRGGRFQPMASDRAFLKTNRAPTPELMTGMNGDEGHVIKYIPFEDASDSEEADMNISDNEDESEQPPNKHARTERKAADGNSVPKWSNPDPYTALPPPDDSQRKKKDVVRLIRKARVSNNLESTLDAGATADDFISFDLGGDSIEIEDDSRPTLDVAEAPTGPRNGHKPQDQKNGPILGGFNPPSAPRNSSVQKPDVIGFTGLDALSDPALGNRKRTIRDEIVGPPKLYKSSGNRGGMASGVILDQWAPSLNLPKTPWLVRDHSQTPNMGFWLHKEIIDWYNFVEPRAFEELIRTKLVEDLNHRVRRSMRDASVHSFGSFPARLYLPTSDMDLVLVSDQFMSGRLPKYHTNKDLNRFSNFLIREHLASPDTIEVVRSAKVPLVKYIDSTTGLRVDISFENNTGLIANKTFEIWKTQFPAMPILVTLIKHLLTMRGLNEPVNGGIGGFSITCLVVSLLQNMPQVQSRTMIPEHHLGEILMEFLNLYGNQFNVTLSGIQLNPPGYFAKARNRAITYNQREPTKFCIIDPNNPANDITGGARNTPRILQLFSDSYKYLQRRMGELLVEPNRQNQSVLGCIMAGNYSSFKLQREHIAHVHEKLFGKVSEDF